MRILQLLSSTGFHGAETMTAELVRQLHRLGVSVDVGVFDNAGNSDRTIFDAVAPYIRESVVIPCNGQLDWSAVRFLRRYALSQRIDLLHSHKYKTTFYGLCAKPSTGAALVVTYHNWLTDTWPLKMYAALDKRLARFCDAAVGVSEPVTEELKRYASPTKIMHIGNGVDTARFQRVASRTEAKRLLGISDNPLLGFVGRLTPAKGLIYLLRALTTLPNDLGKTTHLVIVGDGEYRMTLIEEIRALGLEDRVHLLGTRHDTPLVYSALDAFVLPSFVEAFPMVVLEAMACGVPVIATSVGDVPRILEHGVSGAIVAPGDVDALRTAIARVLTDDDHARRLAASGPTRVTERFSSAAMARTYLALYEQVLRQRSTYAA